MKQKERTITIPCCNACHYHWGNRCRLLCKDTEGCNAGPMNYSGCKGYPSLKYFFQCLFYKIYPVSQVFKENIDFAKDKLNVVNEGWTQFFIENNPGYHWINKKSFKQYNHALRLKRSPFVIIFETDEVITVKNLELEE